MPSKLRTVRWLSNFGFEVRPLRWLSTLLLRYWTRRKEDNMARETTDDENRWLDAQSAQAEAESQIVEPWKPQHIRGITNSNKTNQYECIFCKMPWPCEGACEEMCQVLQHAGQLYREFIDHHAAHQVMPEWADWAEQELLPVLKAGR